MKTKKAFILCSTLFLSLPFLFSCNSSTSKKCELILSNTSFEEKESTSYSIKVDGKDYTGNYELISKNSLVSFVKSENVIFGVTSGKDEITLKIEGYEEFKTNLEVLKSTALTIDEAIKYGVKNAPGTGQLTSEVKISGLVSEISRSDQNGYKTIYLQDEIVDENTFNDITIYVDEETASPIERGCSYNVKGKLKNFFGMYEIVGEPISFDPIYYFPSEVDPLFISKEELLNYRQGIFDATNKANSNETTYENALKNKYVCFDDVYSWTSFDGNHYLKSSYHGDDILIDYSFTNSKDIRDYILEYLDTFFTFTIYGYLIGGNSNYENGVINMMVTNALLRVDEVKNVTLSLEKEEISGAEEVGINVSTDPERALLQNDVIYHYDDTYIDISPLDVISIKTFPSTDTEVTITASVCGVTSNPVTLLVHKKAEQGEVYFSKKFDELIINGENELGQEIEAKDTEGKITHFDYSLDIDDYYYASINHDSEGRSYVKGLRETSSIMVIATYEITGGTQKQISFVCSVSYDTTKKIHTLINDISTHYATFNECTYCFEVTDAYIVEDNYSKSDTIIISNVDKSRTFEVYKPRIHKEGEEVFTYNEDDEIWDYDLSKGNEPTSHDLRVGQKITIALLNSYVHSNFYGEIFAAEDIFVKDFTLEDMNISLSKMDAKIVPISNPSIFVDNYTYFSNNQDIVDVDYSSGLLTPKKAGEADIEVTYTNPDTETHESLVKHCKVTVNDNTFKKL